MVNIYWLGFCILLFNTFEYFPTNSWVDTPFYITQSLRFRQDAVVIITTRQKSRIFCPKETVHHLAETLRQVTIQIAHCCGQQCPERAALWGLTAQPWSLMMSMNHPVSSNVETTELIQHRIQTLIRHRVLVHLPSPSCSKTEAEH